ncbi:MAG: hypothetical protein CME70_00595 [Halobacteriovorax sp.]|nr:hypothetical protein [Halobacteriovorax sp.]
MHIEIPISLGELLDKLSILMIKSEMISDKEKLKDVAIEERLLKGKVEALGIDSSELFEELLQINKKLWKIEDDIREKERKDEFDKEFIELARSVYITNDQRFDIKNRINLKFGSAIKEVKSYEEY